jgi:23S rRNA U2552 (ribose-2'-O)-methylase RlmE/FtsJ
MDAMPAVRDAVFASVEAWDNLRITAAMPDAREGLRNLAKLHAVTSDPASASAAASSMDEVAQAALQALPCTLEQVLLDPVGVYEFNCFLTAFQARARLAFLEQALLFRSLAGVTPAALRER